jgi:sialate O-acetylesterase
MRIFFLFLFVVGIWKSATAQIVMPKVFSSHMVLQREVFIPVWGNAKAGTTVIVELGNVKSSGKADEKGKWDVRLPKFSAGGPYTLKIYEASSSASAIEFSDVLIGDVWLASGQSNMEWAVQASKDAKQEISKANYPNIRFFFVEHEKAILPQADIKSGSWKVCDTNNVKTASAVAYFFARKINKDINIPIGILQSTWGGTPVEAWTSREMLLSSPITKDKVLANDSVTVKHFIKDSLDLIKFWDIVYNPQNDMDKIIPQNNFDDWQWTELTFPSTLKDWGISPYEGMIWFRKTIALPEKFSGKDLTINLGHPELNYSLYFNGEPLCKTIWNANLTHTYTIPKKLVKKGNNTIVVRIAALWGGGGINPPAEDLYLTDGKNKISLAGSWKYKKDMEPAIPKINNYHYYPDYVYNAMIVPIVPYGIKGFLWYQGEANTAEADYYRTLFPMLITDWRIRWQQDYLPFLYVQLANYMKMQPEPSESEWAELREAQTFTLSQPNTGMACTIDIGDGNNIHPINKQEVGRRLALIAEKMVYDKPKEVASGPMYQSFRIEGKSIRIRFKETGSGMTTRNNELLKGFAIAGNDQKFYWASAKIEGNEIIVTSDKVDSPVAVRYAWADNPDCNLMNKEGLPAIPFRTDTWQKKITK